MKIALMGFEFDNANKGCEALTYSFVNMLRECGFTDLELHLFGYSELGYFPMLYPEIKFVRHRIKLKNPLYWFKMKREFDQMDCIVDITFGDGFSDIYGKRWNIATNLAKQIAEISKTPFILMPQTYGPFHSVVLKKWAYKLIQNADIAFARNNVSYEQNGAFAGNLVREATDLAFALPYNKEQYTFNNKKKIGINISALLWCGGHASTIKLKTDYKKYLRDLLERLIAMDYEIHLIPHVVDEINYESNENDYRVCKEFHEQFPNAILGPAFKTPIDAKSYISNMDVFIGARMHATIGAFSSGVVTIPFCYSHKFEEVYGSVNYPYLIDATKMTTEAALERTVRYLNSLEQLRMAQNASMDIVKNKLQTLDQMIEDIIKSSER